MALIIDSFIKNGNLVLNKTVLGWIAGGAVTFVNVVFYFGVSKANTANNVNNSIKELKEIAIQQHNDVVELKKTFTDFTTSMNNKINKVYDDEYDRWNDYQTYSKKQFDLIIEYGSSNKKLMKDMIDMNHTEELNRIRKEIEKDKNDIGNKSINDQIVVDSTFIANNKKNRKIIGKFRDNADTTEDSIASNKSK